VDEQWVVDTLIKIAETGGFEKLETFDWDGCEMPDDRLWVVLQERCSELKTIYCNVGDEDINPDSSVRLFNAYFRSLVTFSLALYGSLALTAPGRTILSFVTRHTFYTLPLAKILVI
jgi:hypothetical protein